MCVSVLSSPYIRAGNIVKVLYRYLRSTVWTELFTRSVISHFGFSGQDNGSDCASSLPLLILCFLTKAQALNKVKIYCTVDPEATQHISQSRLTSRLNG